MHGSEWNDLATMANPWTTTHNQNMSTIYHNPRCGTSRNTLARLEEAGHNVEVIEYLKNPLDKEGLRKLIADANLSVKEAVRSKESLFTELNLESVTDEELLDAMAAHPILMNRPFVITEKGTRLCRPKEVVEEIL